MRLRARAVAGVVLLGALAGGMLAGCAAPEPPFAAAATIEDSTRAAVRWRGPAGEFAGWVTLEVATRGEVRVTVRESMDGETRLTLTRTRGEWTTHGPLVGRSWRGVENTAPARVTGWLVFVEALEGARLCSDGERDGRTGRYSMRSDKRDGRLRAIEVVVVATGDRFRADFDGD